MFKDSWEQLSFLLGGNMDIRLFERIYKIIKSETEISEYELYVYFLQIRDKNILFSEDDFSMLKSGKKTLFSLVGENEFVNLRNSTISNEKVINEFEYIFPQINMYSKLKEDICQFYGNSIWSDRYSNLFPSQKNSFSKLGELFFREYDMKQLNKTLENNKQILLTGTVGCGKTHFVKHFCYEQSKKGTDIYYIEFDGNVSNTLKKVAAELDKVDKGKADNVTNESNANRRRRHYFEELTLRDPSVVDECQNSCYSRVLVIDQMQYPIFSTDAIRKFENELNMLASYPISIIVVTDYMMKEDVGQFKLFSLCDFEDDDFANIFSYFLKSEMSEETKTMLCNLDKNVGLARLVSAQALKISSKTNYNDINSIACELLGLWVMPRQKLKLYGIDNKKIYINENGSKNQTMISATKLTMLRWLGYLGFDDEKKDANNCMNAFLFLCCFGYRFVAREFWARIIPYYEENESALVDLGLLQIDDWGNARVPTYIGQGAFASIINTDMNTAVFESVIDNLSEYLKGYQVELDIPYLGDSLYVFWNTVKQVTMMWNNKNPGYVSVRYSKVQELGFLTAIYYCQNRELMLATCIIQNNEIPKDVGVRTYGHVEHDIITSCLYINYPMNDFSEIVDHYRAFSEYYSKKPDKREKNLSPFRYMELSLFELFQVCVIKHMGGEDTCKCMLEISNILKEPRIEYSDTIRYIILGIKILFFGNDIDNVMIENKNLGLCLSSIRLYMEAFDTEIPPTKEHILNTEIFCSELDNIEKILDSVKVIPYNTAVICLNALDILGKKILPHFKELEKIFSKAEDLYIKIIALTHMEYEEATEVKKFFLDNYEKMAN